MLSDNLAGLIEPMLSSAGAYPLALCTDRNQSSDDRPQNALKIPARQGGIYALTENVPFPFHAEPGHDEQDRVTEAYRDHWDRILGVKSKYDPGNFFRFNQNVPPRKFAKEVP